jgi:SAM-dependent methyltransferase
MASDFSCPACGSKRSSRWATSIDYNQAASKEEFSYRKCVACGTVYIEKVPADISKHYPTRYSQYRFFRKGVGEAEVMALEREKISKVLKALGNDVKGKKILDVGSGQGGFMAECKNAGMEPFGNEFSPDGAKKCREFGEVEQGDFLKSHFNREFFDAITFWHSLEHLPNAFAATSKAHSLLKPGGLLFIAVPNPESLQGRLFKRFWAHLDAPRHLILVPPMELSKRLGEQGFRTTSIDQFMNDYNAWGIGMSVLNLLHLRSGMSGEGNPALKALGRVIFTIPAVAESLVGKGGTYLLVAKKV